MNDTLLKALMQLFALATTFNNRDARTIENNEILITQYLRKRLSNEMIERYLKFYQDTIESLLADPHYLSPKKVTLRYVRLYKIAQKISKTLSNEEKFVLLVRFYEFLYADKNISRDEREIIETLAEVFGFEKSEIENLIFFIVSDYDNIKNKENLVVYSPVEQSDTKIKYYIEPNLDKPIYIYYFKSLSKFIFKYEGALKLRLTGTNIYSGLIHFLDRGSIIKGNNIQPIYQTTIEHHFTQQQHSIGVKLIAEQIEYKFNEKDYGLHPISFEFQSGQMIGIMGPSGAGKTTLVNILVGKNKPTNGNVYINGHNIFQKDTKIKDCVGLVPQDDLLIEDLTVWQNLYYSSKLIYGNLTDKEICEKVDKVLKELDLIDQKDLKVGNPLEKYISGGQRKRLNIALELVREPSILFIDEPTSGLSSLDSEMVMDLLKTQALKGKLIVVNIHQPSSDIFKLFDKILILDKGGYSVYLGNPLEAIGYFKEINNYVDYEQLECDSCGNVKTDEILEIVEEKAIDDNGKPTNIRKTTPAEWYTLFKVNFKRLNRIVVKKEQLPQLSFQRPSKLKQFKIFVTRDVLSKIADKQYMLINLLEAPVLAIVLSIFSKKIPVNSEYTFADNTNIPVFLFMIVVVAMFMGLTCSAEELIKDRKIIERERFLNLSRFSYLMSKNIILAVLSAYQSFVFLLFSFIILKFPTNFFVFWGVMFLTAYASNMLGLLISSFAKNIVTVYITIPLVLVPQMLLGGTMIKFEDMHPIVSSKKYTPIIADLMFSRWAYEALAVETFVNNDYSRLFYEIDKQKSYYVYVSAYLLPHLKTVVNKITSNADTNDSKKNFLLLKNEFAKLKQNYVFAKLSLDLLNNKDIDYINKNKQTVFDLIEKVKVYSSEAFTQLNKQKDVVIDSIVNSRGSDYLNNLRKVSFNEKLADIMLDKYSTQIFIELDNEIVRKRDAAYIEPQNRFGRSHYYSPTKKLLNQTISTVLFNSVILLIFAILLYFGLFVNTSKLKFLKIDFLKKIRKKED